MTEIVGECDICGVELYDQEEAYALTPGVMSKEMQDFCMSDSMPWEVICCECIDELDKAITQIRDRFQSLRERKTA